MSNETATPLDPGTDRLERLRDVSATAAKRGAEQVRRAGSVVRPHLERVASTAAEAGRTVVGQARSALDRTGREATTGVKEVAGQARSVAARTGSEAEKGVKEVAGQAEAQGERVADEASDAAEAVVGAAERAVDDRPAPGVAYEEWTRQQLYERAQERRIEGRATMTKAELISALRD